MFKLISSHSLKLFEMCLLARAIIGHRFVKIGEGFMIFFINTKHTKYIKGHHFHLPEFQIIFHAESNDSSTANAM